MKTVTNIFLIMWHIIILFWIWIIWILLMSFPVIICIFMFVFYDWCLWSALNQIWASQPYSIRSVNQLFSTSELIIKNESYIWMNCRLYPTHNGHASDILYVYCSCTCVGAWYWERKSERETELLLSRCHLADVCAGSQRHLIFLCPWQARCCILQCMSWE